MDTYGTRSNAGRSVKKRQFSEAFANYSPLPRRTVPNPQGGYKDPAVSDLDWVQNFSKYLLSGALRVGLLSVKALVAALVALYGYLPKPSLEERPPKRRRTDKTMTRKKSLKKNRDKHRKQDKRVAAAEDKDVEVIKVQLAAPLGEPLERAVDGIEAKEPLHVIDKQEMRPIRLYSKHEGGYTPSRVGRAQGGLLSPMDREGPERGVTRGDNANVGGSLATLHTQGATVKDRFGSGTPIPADASVIIPNVTYGTSFFLRQKHSSTERAVVGQVSDLTSRLRRVYTHADDRALSADEQQVVKLLNIEKQNQQRKNPFFHLPRPSRDAQHYISNLEARQKDLENAGIAPTPVRLPDEAPIITPERAARYAQIHKARKDLEEQIARLKLGDRAEEETIRPVESGRLKVIERYWHGRYAEGQIIGTAFKVDLMVGDVRTLRDGVWLNDNVIDFYAAAVTHRESSRGKLKSFAFSTHFFSKLTSPGGYKNVMRWAKRKGVDVTTEDLVFIPINENNNHWVLAVVNNKERQFLYYNSMNGDGQYALQRVRDYMIQEATRIYPSKAAEYEERFMSYQMLPRAPCPQQSNYYDCGIFTCKNIERLASGMPLNYSQKDMKLMRRHIANELLMAAESSQKL